MATLVTITGLWAQTGNSFTERQLRQLNLRSERVAAQIAQTEQLQATEPNDSLAVVLHELRRQAQTIAQTIARLEAKQQEALTEATAPTETEEQQQEVDELVERLANPFKFAMMRYAIIEREIVAEFDTYRNLYDTARLNTTRRPAWMNLVIVQTEENNNSAVNHFNNPDPTDCYTPWKE